VWLTRDGGHHWSDVTPPGVTAWSKVTQIEASHFDLNTAFCSASRFRVDELHPFVYRTRDGGKSWQAIVEGLPPDAPVNAVREDPVRRGLLYAATERAVWVSFDDGEHWDSLQGNLPHTSVRDIAIHDSDLIVATHGRGFWILDDISRLRQLSPVRLKDVFLVAPATATRLTRSTWTDTPIPPDEPMAANPPAGAVIDYFLPREVQGTVVLEVLDAHGGLVRRYASDERPEPSAEDLAHQLIPPYWVAEPRSLAKGAGMHRWVWDLRYPPPFAITHGYPIAAVPHATPREPLGPVAVPGIYTVRLTVDGRRIEAPLELKADPRLRLAPGALEDQYRLATRLAALLGESSRTLLAARSVEAQLKALPPTGPAAPAIKTFATRLATLIEPEGPAGPAQDKESRLLRAIQTDIRTLYGAVTRNDAAPTAAQARESEVAAAAYATLLESWHALEAELPALNAQLQSAKLAGIRPELPPPADLNAADEE
jgi:hypothetical protein